MVQAVEDEPVFRSCPRTDVVRAMSHMEPRRLEDGDSPYRRGDNVHHTYFVISGTIAIRKSAAERRKLTIPQIFKAFAVATESYLP